MVQARVTAVHDWGSQNCKSCSKERVDINFDKGGDGASGSMDSVSLGIGESHALPGCGFTAPAGKEFSHWRVQVGGEEPKDMEVGDVIATDNATVTAVYEDAATEPEFKTYGLTLTGQIGLSVFLNLPEVDGASYEGSYVEFTVDGNRNGRTVRVSRDPGFRDVNTGRYYGFTLPLTSIEMARTCRRPSTILCFRLDEYQNE
jgi:hypothetical protein